MLMKATYPHEDFFTTLIAYISLHDGELFRLLKTLCNACITHEKSQVPPPTLTAANYAAKGLFQAMFLAILQHIGFDVEVAIDWLLDVESEFLECLVVYLKLGIAQNTARGTQPPEPLAIFFNVLYAKLCAVSKSFPYTITPLQKLLERYTI